VPSKSKDEIEWLRMLAERRLRESIDRVKRLQRLAEDRDDFAGVNLLLRMLLVMIRRTEALINESLLKAERSRSSARKLELATVRTAIVQLEGALSGTCSPLASPPERDVAALIQPYVRLAKRLTKHAGTELIFESREFFEYEVWADVFEDIREFLQIVAPSIDLQVDNLPPFALISYPVRADSETLLHAVIAHEVIHLGLFSKREEGDPAVGDVFIEKFRERVIKADGHDPDEVRKRSRRLESWLNECLADSLALLVIGPAFYFALVEYLQPTHLSGSAADEVHPSPLWRLERLRSDVANFFEDRSGHRGEAAVAFDRFLDLVPAPGRGQSEEEREDQEILTEMVAALDLQQLAGGATYPVDRFRRDLPLVWEKLDQGIAPVERVKGRRFPGKPGEDKAPLLAGDPQPVVRETNWSQSLDWRSILNGGYLHYLHRALIAREGSAQALRDEVNSLVRGSIELSELHRKMIELHDEFEPLGPIKEEA
jgi:hypothetical protein